MSKTTEEESFFIKEHKIENSNKMLSHPPHASMIFLLICFMISAQIRVSQSHSNHMEFKERNNHANLDPGQRARLESNPMVSAPSQVSRVNEVYLTNSNQEMMGIDRSRANQFQLVPQNSETNEETKQFANQHRDPDLVSLKEETQQSFRRPMDPQAYWANTAREPLSASGYGGFESIQPKLENHADRTLHNSQRAATVAPNNLRQTTSTDSSSFLSSSTLEIALRQASGDEGFFQPSPVFGPTRHLPSNDEWLIRSRLDANNGGQNSGSEMKVDAMSSTNAPAAREQGNIVLDHAAISIDPTIQSSNLQAPMTREYPTNSINSSNVSPINEQQLDFNNQVTYERPPASGQESASGGDSYYFSATEKDRSSNNYNSNPERVPSIAWW